MCVPKSLPCPRRNTNTLSTQPSTVGHFPTRRCLRVDPNPHDLQQPCCQIWTLPHPRRDGRCLITSSRDCIERAHLYPLEKAEWFKRNRMGIYNIKRVLGCYLLDDNSNAFALRSDLHTTFDDRKFLISRKNSEWAVHFLELTNELGALYHNTPIKLANNVSPFFLLARFAWKIFPLLREFLDNGLSRRFASG